jgi:polyhydroxybutyrate depolymerase
MHSVALSKLEEPDSPIHQRGLCELGNVGHPQPELLPRRKGCYFIKPKCRIQHSKNLVLENLTMINLRLILLIATTVALAACSDGSDGPLDDRLSLQGCADTGSCASNPTLVIGGARPAMVEIPADYDSNTSYPLVVVLHGRGASGLIQSFYFGLFDRVNSKQFVLVLPDGIVSSDGGRIWNATPACCATTPEEAEVDDVAYISGLIREAAATYNIDAGRIGLIGHSNGGFMSFTMACEASELVTSLVSLAGSTFEDLESCGPATERVSVLAVHGDADDTVPYDGFEGAIPGARETAERYALLAGCDTTSPMSRPPQRDLVSSIDGAETSVIAWPDCLSGTEVELWTIAGGPHIPAPWVAEGIDSFVGWLLEHRRD